MFILNQNLPFLPASTRVVVISAKSSQIPCFGDAESALFRFDRLLSNFSSFRDAKSRN